MTPEPALVGYPPTFWSLVERRAAASADRTMVVDDRGRELTFGAYRRACEQVAAGLAAQHGVRAGDVVSWQLPTTIETLVLMGALARLGAVQNPIVPIQREREVGFIADQVRPRLLVVPGTWRGFDHAAMASAVSHDVGCDVLTLDHSGVAPLPTGGPDDLPPLPPPDPAATRWLYHSSGTTADPKGVRHTDRSVMHGATGFVQVLGLGPSDVYPIAFPIAHIGGANALTAHLVTGARLAVCATFDPERSPGFMADVGATLLGSALPFFHAYLDAQRRAGDRRLFPALRAGINGGAPKPPGLHQEVKERLGGVGILGAWGLTEFPIATFGSPHDTDDQLSRTEGRPVPGVRLRVVDDDGRDVGPGEEGELLLAGPQLCAGYVDPALDHHAFDERGFLRTGDRGYVDPSGHVTVTGRSKDVVIRNAETLSSQEIEHAVARHPDVAEVAVIGVPDPRTGERACAVIVPVPGRPAPTLADLGEHCRRLGLANQKVPERIELVDALPRNALGKVLKRDLRARYLAREARR